MSSELTQLLATYPPDVQTLARTARSFIRDVVPDAEEAVDLPARVVGYGFGPGYKNLLCTLILSKTGVKIGISNAASLPDPDRLLKGSGKVHRYVPLQSSKDLTPAVRALLRSAAARKGHPPA